VYLKENGLDFGYRGHAEDYSFIELERRGTHDLSDAKVDLTRLEMLTILAEAAIQLSAIHKFGYVHRDLKPGNIMLDRIYNTYRFSGLIDFGLSLRKNTLQNEAGATGGTRVFAHQSQFNPEAVAAYGQDWYSFAMIVLTITRGLATSVESELTSERKLAMFLDEAQNSHIDPEIQSYLNSLQELIDLAVDCRTLDTTTEHLNEAGVKLVASASNILSLLHEKLKWRNNRWMNRPARTRALKVKSHDVLIIIDETGSISTKMENIKQVLNESIGEFHNAMDLRVDIWAVRDYARDNDESHQTIRRVGYRLVGKNILTGVDLLRADAAQHDRAEAYEEAMEEAYLNAEKDRAKWKPRKNALKTVVLIGDSYAHGWLRKKWIDLYHRDLNTSTDKKSKMKELKLVSQFKKLHPDAISDLKKLNHSRHAALKRQKSGKSTEEDEFGEQVQWVPSSKGKKKQRANLQYAIQRLRERQDCSIHTISLNWHILSDYYMKFVSMLGGGTFVKGEDNIGEKIIGILALADPGLLERFRQGWRRDGRQGAAEDTMVFTTFTAEHLNRDDDPDTDLL
jgi:DNA-binding winged helix-turn-helix (wHTH) protein